MNRYQLLLLVLFLIGVILVIRQALRRTRQWLPDEVDRINDENTMRVAEEAWRTGKPVMGYVDEDGNLKMEVLDDDCR